MSFTRTGVALDPAGLIPPSELPTTSLTYVSADKLVLDPGDVRCVDGTALVSMDYGSHDHTVVTTVNGASGTFREYNPWVEALKLMLTSKAIIHMTIRKDVWEKRETTSVTTMGDEMIHAFQQIGYSHRIEHTAGLRGMTIEKDTGLAKEFTYGAKMKVFFVSETTAEDKVELDIVAEAENVLIESTGIDFANELKDL